MKILIVFVLLCMNLLILIFLWDIHSTQEDNFNKLPNYEKQYLYKKTSLNFYDDPFLLNISNLCLLSGNKVKCVYDNIPFKWEDRDRDGILSINEYIVNDYRGLCRDITIYRYVVLKNIGVECNFNFNILYHVYLNCYEGENVYELNNEFYIEK